MNIEFYPFASREIKIPTDDSKCLNYQKYDPYGDFEDSDVIPRQDHKKFNFINREIQKYKTLEPSNLEAVKVKNSIGRFRECKLSKDTKKICKKGGEISNFSSY